MNVAELYVSKTSGKNFFPLSFFSKALTVVFIALHATSAFTEEVQQPDDPQSSKPSKRLSSFGTNFTGGTNQYSDAGISFVMGLTKDGDIGVTARSSRSGGQVDSRSYEASSSWYFQKAGLTTFSLGTTTSDGLKTSDLSIKQNIRIDSQLESSSRSNLGVSLRLTSYTDTTTDLSFRETALGFSFDQGFTDSLEAGISYNRNFLPARSQRFLKSFTTYTSIGDGMSYAVAGLLESSSSLYVTWLVSLRNDLEISFGSAKLIDGTADHRSVSLQWSYHFSESWHSRLSTSSVTSQEGTRSSTIGIGVTYFW